MRFSTTAVLAATSIATVAALPKTLIKRATADIDADILQYALTLEHLENAFYKEALSKWSVDQFTAAGFSAAYYNDLKYVAHDEEGHVLYLESGLTSAGAKPVAACTYSFGLTTPQAFVATAATIEGVGVSAYLGAAPLITSKAYLTAAGAILVTEALHQSLQRGAIGEIPAANVFGTPMGLNATYSIAAGFITACPSTNAPLPVAAFQPLTLVSGLPTAENATVNLSTKNMPAGPLYLTFVSGLDIIPAPASANTATGHVSAAVPVGVSGQSYVFLTTDNSGNLTDSSIVAGPAIIQATPNSPTFSLSVTK